RCFARERSTVTCRGQRRRSTRPTRYSTRRVVPSGVDAQKTPLAGGYVAASSHGIARAKSPVGLPSPGLRTRGGVAMEHLRRRPPRQTDDVGVVATAAEEAVDEAMA